jgi:lysozyme
MTTLAGIDVSAAGQGPDFPWQQYKNKIGFAGVKISEGTTYADPDAKANVAQAHALGIPVIGYHLLHAAQQGSQQAEWFLRCADGLLKPGRDLIAVDAEDAGLDGCPASEMNLAAVGFWAQLQKHFPGYNPPVYTEESMAPSLASLGHCPLWLADLSSPLTQAIGPWGLVSFWQTGQRGVDCDLFNGAPADLAKLAFR